MDNLVFKLTVQDDGSAKISAFESKIRGLQQETATLSSKMKDAFNGAGKIIVNFAAKAGREFVKFSKDSVNAFLKFETAMVAVAKTTGIPKEAIGKFSEQIRQTAVDLKGLGKDAAVQIAATAEIAGQLGIASGKLANGDFEAATKEILKFSTTIAKAKISLPEFSGGVEQIATVVAKQISLYGETSYAAEQYLSVMNKLSDTTAATAVDIASFISKFTIAPTLKMMQEDAAAWGATFVSLGQNPSDAATRMQSAYAMMLKGSKDVNAALSDLFSGNDKMAKQLEELAGRSVKTFENGSVAVGDYSNLVREAIGVDANAAMKLIVTTLSEVESSSARSEIAFKAFGQVGARAILTLIPELPKLSDAAKDAATVFLSTNEQALDSLAEMSGVSRDKFSDNADFMAAVYKKDMPDAIRVLVQEINKIDDETEKARVASEVFGEDWEVTMNKAEGGVKKFDEAWQTAQKEIEATKNGASSIEKEYSTALDKVGTSFSELTVITDDLKLQWGAPLAEALSAGIKLMIPVLEELRVNFVGVVEEFGRELGGESLASAFRQMAEAFKGTIEEMGANADIFVQSLAEQFTFPNLMQTAWDQWSKFIVGVGDSVATAMNDLGTALDQEMALARAATIKVFTDIAAKVEEAFKAIAAAVLADIKQIASDVADVIKDIIPGGESGSVKVELLTGAAGALEELQQLRTSVGGFRDDQTELQALYKEVWNGMKDAIAANEQPSEDLIGKMNVLKESIKAVGVEAYGNSTFPDMTAAMQASEAQTQVLTAEMQAMEDQIKSIGKEYEETNAQIKDKQKTVRDLNSELRDMQAKARTASKEEKDGIQASIVALQNKRGAIQNEISDLQNLASDQREARQAEVDALKEGIEAQKKKIQANEELRKNLERTADLQQKQQQDEMKAANELYREQQKQAADSIKWITQIDDASKKRLLGEKDAVAILKAQGVTLTDLQAQEVRRMQGAYKTEQAYEAQAKALQEQLDPMGTLIAAGDKLSGSLGGLSGGIGKIGDLFGFDTSKITGIFDKLQGVAQLPQTIKGITDSIGGIGQAFGSLGGIGSSLSGILGGAGGGLTSILGGLGGALGGVVAAAGPFALAGGAIFAAWKGISALMQDTKSKGTEAALAMQDFVKSGISGGAELAAAMGTAFDTMTANNFDFQASLNASGSTMSQVMGGISANWQQGSTAMDIFTQAVGRATGDMQKAPQVALQMTMGFDQMGLSAAQAGEKMVEIATKAGMSTEEIEKLKAALAAGGKEGESTTEVFDAATQAAETLAGTTQALTDDVSGLTSKLSGAGAEGGDTAAIFRTATDAAQQLSGQTDQLSSQVSDLTNQMGSAGSSTIQASNMFDTAGGSANNLSGNMDSLAAMARDAGIDVDTLKRMLEALPAKKDIEINVKTNGSVPAMATGGIIGRSGLAIVNERGAEIANLPGFGMALMTARGATLGAFPVGTEIIPHAKSMQLLRENPSIPRMATGGTITAAKAGAAVINNYYNYTVNLSAPVIDRNTARMIDAELQKLSKQRAGV